MSFAFHFNILRFILVTKIYHSIVNIWPTVSQPSSGWISSWGVNFTHSAYRQYVDDFNVWPPFKKLLISSNQLGDYHSIDCVSECSCSYCTLAIHHKPLLHPAASLPLRTKYAHEVGKCAVCFRPCLLILRAFSSCITSSSGSSIRRPEKEVASTWIQVSE